jgi:hypothetical protein
MPYKPSCGDCLLIPYNNVPHLFVVMNDPCKDKLCLLVMVSSIKENRHHDDACILKKGDHDFISRRSYVVYRLAETSLASHITNMVEKNFYVRKGTLSNEVFNRIVDGLETSSETRPTMLKFAREVGLID